MGDDFDNWLANREKEAPVEDVSVEDGELSAGTLVGDYRIVAHLGRGGFADVYRASGKNGEKVAVKMLHKLDDKSRARFARESEILLQIRHCDNIPRLLGFGSFGDRPYMVLELLNGFSLPSSDGKVAKFVKQVISAVEALHRHGFVHRDIKPANILSRDDGTPVLIDFGLATPLSVAQRETDGLSIEEGKRIAVGTVGWAAPEQFSGLPAGREADVHAIGMLVNECFTEKMPGSWRRIYLTATASNPKARYRTVQELRRAVDNRHLRKALGFALVAVLVLVAAFAANRLAGKGEVARGDNMGELVYGFEDDGHAGRKCAVVLKAQDARGDFVIPAKKDGCAVTRIGENAFDECKALTSVTIPDGVRSIGDWAFGDCSALMSVRIPASVTNIGDGAFDFDDTALRTVYVSVGDVDRVKKLLLDSGQDIDDVKFEEVK